MEFNAPDLDWKDISHLVFFAGTLAAFGVFVLWMSRQEEKRIVKYIQRIAGVTLFAAVFCLVYDAGPFSYRLEKESIEVVLVGPNIYITLREIEEARPVEQGSLQKLYKARGYDGFGYRGIFHAPALGHFMLLSPNPHSAAGVLLQLKQPLDITLCMGFHSASDRVVLTPSDPRAFLAALEARGVPVRDGETPLEEDKS